MKVKKLLNLMQNEGLLTKEIEFHMKKKNLTKIEKDIFAIKGHLEKAQHNLEFINTLKDSKFSDWSLVGCYYAVYQSALSLLINKGFFSKNHDATLCILIKEYMKKELDEEDIKLLNNPQLRNEDILTYVQSKEEREKASYSTQILFDKEMITELKKKAIVFVNKCREILEQK